jgi:hypothetical protein
VSTPAEKPIEPAHTTYSGVGALDRTNTAITGHAASQTRRVDGGSSIAVDAGFVIGHSTSSTFLVLEGDHSGT